MEDIIIISNDGSFLLPIVFREDNSCCFCFLFFIIIIIMNLFSFFFFLRQKKMRWRRYVVNRNGQDGAKKVMLSFGSNDGYTLVKFANCQIRQLFASGISNSPGPRVNGWIQKDQNHWILVAKIQFILTKNLFEFFLINFPNKPKKRINNKNI